MPKELSQAQLVNALADMEPGYAAVLFGAGASRSSGVLLAREIVHDLGLTAYCREFGIAPAQRERVTTNDVRQWIELQEWYQSAKARGETDYSAVFRQFKPTQDHQIQYIQRLVLDAKPSPAYGALAQVVHDGYLNTLLTTNFDPLFENCYSGMFPSEVSLRSIATDDEFSQLTGEPNRRVLAYLHGNLNGYHIANLDEDTRLLRPQTESAMGRLLNPSSLLVVGYSGWDSSVMKLLIHLAKTEPSAFRRGVVYWCRQPGSHLSPLAQEFLNTVENGIEVEIHGFDRLAFELAEAFGIDCSPFIDHPPSFPSDSREVAAEPAVLNLASLQSLPKEILKFRTGVKNRRDLPQYRDNNAWWQATIHDGYLWLLGDVNELPDSLRNKCSETPESVPLSVDTLQDPMLWNVFAELANKGLDHTLRHEHHLRTWKGQRYFFAKPLNSDERSIKYRSRRKRATRRVVWFEFERGTESDKKRYFCHETLRTRVMRFRGRPVLRLQPTRLFTVSGAKVWDSEKAHTSIGRSTGKVWNLPFNSLVRLWLDVLSGSSTFVPIRFSADSRREEYRLSFDATPCPARKVRQ